MLDTLRRDFRFAVRQLRQVPGFTATAIVVLALGMCASVTIFSFVDAALIKPLPYRDPNRLVGVFETNALVAQSNLSRRKPLPANATCDLPTSSAYSARST
jgi:hypothetical protein